MVLRQAHPHSGSWVLGFSVECFWLLFHGLAFSVLDHQGSGIRVCGFEVRVSGLVFVVWYLG